MRDYTGGIWGLYRAYIGMEKKMETAILGFRVSGFGVRGVGLRV